MALGYDVLVALPPPAVPPDGTSVRPVPAWSPIASTLIHGERHAILVDAPHTEDKAREVADWVAASGKNLLAQIVKDVIVPTAIDGHTVGLEGHEVRFVEAGDSDRCPALHAVAGWGLVSTGRSTANVMNDSHPAVEQIRKEWSGEPVKETLAQAVALWTLWRAFSRPAPRTAVGTVSPPARARGDQWPAMPVRHRVMADLSWTVGDAFCSHWP
ncbi:hypothetical protein ACWEPD_04235 [Streptomyces pseudogriseolus]